MNSLINNIIASVLCFLLCQTVCNSGALYHDWFSTTPFLSSKNVAPRWSTTGGPPAWLETGSALFQYDAGRRDLKFITAGGGGSMALKSTQTVLGIYPPYTVSIDFICENNAGALAVILWAQRQMTDDSHYWVKAFIAGDGTVSWESGGRGLKDIKDEAPDGKLEQGIWYTMALTVENQDEAIKLSAVITDRESGKVVVPACTVVDPDAKRLDMNVGYGFEAWVGDWWHKTVAHFDNFMVYRKERPSPPVEPVLPPAMDADVYQFPTAGAVEFHFNTVQRALSSISTISCKLVDAAGKDVWNGTQDVVNSRASLAFKTFGNLPLGDYILKYTGQSSDGNEVTSGEKTVRRLPDPVWLNNNIGKQDIVPAPWTPVKISGKNAVEIWGRKYVFNNVGLPVSLMATGSDLLKRPMELVTVVNGKAVTFKASGPLKVTPGKTKTVVEGSSVAQGQPNLNLKVSTAVEFDGFAKVDLSLTGASGIKLDRFWLDVPMAKENALFFLPSLGFDAAVPESGLKRPLIGDIELDVANHIYPGFYWVGGDDRGLILTAEDDRYWRSQNRNEAQELVPTSDSIIWRYHFVDESVGRDMSSPLNLTYCFQATPVKPVDDWYSARTASDAMYGMDVQKTYDTGIRQQHIHELWTEIMGYPGTFNNQDDVKGLIKEFSARGMNLCLYSQNAVSDASPTFEQWGGEWLNEIPMVATTGSRSPNYGSMLMQNMGQGIQVPSWSDFYLYNWDRMIREWGANGIYLDGTYQPMLSRNPYYKNVNIGPNGEIRPTRVIYDARDFMKRFYIMAKGHNPNFYMLGHMCTQWFMPTASFIDYSMGGEALSWAMPEGYKTPWSYWRAGNTGRQFGMPREFLAMPNTPEEYSIPLALVHGISLWARGAQLHNVKKYQRAIWDVWEQFGVNDAEWTPYWRNSKFISSDHPDVKVSYYKKPGQVLLAAATNARTKEKATVTIDLKALGLDPKKLTVKAGLGDVIDVKPGTDGKLRLSFPDQTNNGGYVWLRG